MKTDFLKKNWQYILFNFIILFIFIIFYGKFGDIIVDSFREAYIPEQILKGQVLYKNIFTIYAPFSYLFNSLLYFIFGVNLNVLYFSGLLTTIGISNLTFNIAKIFTSKNNALYIVLFFIAEAVLSPNVFNCFLPYSFGMTYGLLFILASIYSILKGKIQLAWLFYSFAICSKYEFLLFLPILFFIGNFKKNWWRNLIAFIFPLAVISVILAIQGVNFKNILTSLQLILIMSSTKTLYWFYSVMGLVFRTGLIPIYLLNMLKIAIPIAFLYYFRSWWLVVITLIYSYFVIKNEIFIYIFPLILILFVIKYRNLNPLKKLFVFASLFVSMKIFFALTLQSYGIYFIPFALISLFIVLPKKFKKSFSTILLICAITTGIHNIQTITNKSVKIQTNRGIVYSTPYYGNSINSLINYVNKEVSEQDKIVIYPELLTINFLTNRNSDNKFYSLIPLYVETFGDDIIISRLELTKPKYIVINNYNTSNYYYSFFGQDYAGEVYSYILQNYKETAIIENGLHFIVFKRQE